MLMPLEVLIVEDNPLDSRLVEQIIEGSTVKVEVTTAMNCARAVQMLSGVDFRPNLVIADMGVLEFGGVELLKVCNPRDIPVVVFSGSANPDAREQILALGAKEFVKKPLTLDSSTEALWMIIGKWARRDSGLADAPIVNLR
jgi:two-component system chemotaxis response regulator CheY